MSDQSLSNIQIFSIIFITAFLHLGRVGTMAALALEGILNREITKKKHKDAKYMALSRLHKEHLLHNTGTRTIRHSLFLFNHSWEPAYCVIQNFCCSAHVYKWLDSTMSTTLGVTNDFGVIKSNLASRYICKYKIWEYWESNWAPKEGNLILFH